MSEARMLERLKNKKMRITQVRKDIFNLLHSSDISLSVKEVFDKVNLKTQVNIDLASVYRNLQLFTELGLVHRFQDGRYSICNQEHGYQHDHDDHVHFVSHCKKCGKSSEVKSHSSDVCRLAGELMALSSPLSQCDEIIIQGYCASCS